MSFALLRGEYGQLLSKPIVANGDTTFHSGFQDTVSNFLGVCGLAGVLVECGGV
jgi:hypothetical protein